MLNNLFKPVDDEQKSVYQEAIDIIDSNIEEFFSIKTGVDPRLPKYKWVTIDEVQDIHKRIISKLGGCVAVHNLQDLKYAIENPLTDIDGIPSKTIFERICLCTFSLCKCFVDCGAQTSATIFILLCKINNIQISLKRGEIYDIFPKIVDYSMSYDEFYERMISNIMPTIKIKTGPAVME